MKRTRQYLMIMATVAAFLCWTGPGGTAWGQLLPGTRLHPINTNITPTDTVVQVNNAFGAGESSYITVGVHGAANHGTSSPQIVKYPWNYTNVPNNSGWSWTPDILYNNSLVDNNPDDIVLGGVKNRVIRAYTGNGFALGWISILNRVASANCIESDCVATPTAWPGYGGQVTGSCNASDATWPSPVYGANNIAESNTYPVKMCGVPASTLWSDRPIYEFSFNKTNIHKFGKGHDADVAWHMFKLTSGIDHSLAPCGWSLFQADFPDPSNKSEIAVTTHIRLDYPSGPSACGADHEGAWIKLTASPTAIPTGLYTSTIDGSYKKEWPKLTFDDSSPTIRYYPIDDGVALVQFSGSNMTDGAALKNQPTYKLKTDASATNALGNPGGLLTNWGDTSLTKNREYLTNYRRPTTILLEAGQHTLKKITVKDIPWQYEIDTVVATPSAGKKLSWCCSGNAMGYSFTVTWDRNDRRDGATLVDGAVALLKEADVCVQEHVSDATANSATEHTVGGTPDDKTDAIIALPKEGRSTLRVGGDIYEINMVNDSVDTKKFYKQENFPKASANIYSYPKNGVGNEFSDPITGYEFGLNSLGKFNDGGKIDLPALKYWTKASVLGVYGNYVYKANNADWHTNLASENITTDHPGVIEIGTTTKGTGHMHIYSGGMLKNFGGCTVSSSFQMYLGCPVPGYGDKTSAQFNLNGNQPLYINRVRRGHCCPFLP